MLTLVLTVCLQAEPTRCKDERIDFNGSATACLVQGSPIIAEWGSDHPEWTIKSWKCGRSREG
ncbi:hypothetical protein K6K41_09225 [Chenggangzhangella methanolivorans]|uniref:Uncharacterized protein n=2 Tax=Chenggangzhangella methanolivorans TaxID=1437009 RepID=A0A9E6URI4_9HYPH|nr:hypothetical protein K6K41_09225 [Chenggangzhangella methanolivorans]